MLCSVAKAPVPFEVHPSRRGYLLRGPAYGEDVERDLPFIETQNRPHRRVAKGPDRDSAEAECRGREQQILRGMPPLSDGFSVQVQLPSLSPRTVAVHVPYVYLG